MKARCLVIFFLSLCILIISPIFNASAQTSPAPPSISQNLTVGDFGPDVASLQAFLIDYGFLNVSGPTGFFAQLTATAVAEWQASVNLPDTGYFGALSRVTIKKTPPTSATSNISTDTTSAPAENARPVVTTPSAAVSTPASSTAVPATSFTNNLSIGATGSEVVALQSFLVRQGFLDISSPTGLFGNLTSAALAKWQAATNLPATGYFGPLSRTDLEATVQNIAPVDTAVTTEPSNPVSVATQAVTPAPKTASVPAVTPTPVVYSGGDGDGGAPAPQYVAPAPTPVPIVPPPDTTPPVISLINPPNNTISSSTITVAAPAPTIPLGLSITGNTSSSITLSWSPSTELGGAITGYQLYRGNAKLATTTGTSFTNTGLTASTTYGYSVSSYDAGGVNSATSTSVSTTTLPLPPPALNYNFGLSLGENPVYLSSAALNQELNTMVSLGIGWIRFDMQWEHVQPTNSSTYNWSLIDPVVAAAAAHHIKVLAILDFTPAWAASSSCTGGNSHCAPADPNAFATFAAAAVQRYSSHGVSDWEIWNEPNNVEFWGPKTDCNAYTALLKAAYPAMKQADPNAFIITAGLSPAATDGFNMAPTDFLSCIYAAGGGNYFDAVGDHPYTFPSFPSNDGGGAWNQMISTTPSLRSIMTANGDSGKKIWVTEFGVPTNGPDSNWYVSEAQQAAMVTDAYNTYASYSWGGPFFWYTYQDGGTSTSTNENFFGLLRADGSAKPAYQTLQNLIATTTAP